MECGMGDFELLSLLHPATHEFGTNMENDG